MLEKRIKKDFTEKLFILNDTYKTLSLKEFNLYDKIELDLGCGKGTFVLELAKQNPKTLFLAVDIKLGRLKKLLNKTKSSKVHNILLLRTLALPLVSFLLPDQILNAVHIVCPDPWPKKKHRKNRMLHSQLFSFLSSKMKKGAYLYLVTDDLNYKKWIEECLRTSHQFASCHLYSDAYLSIPSEFKNLWNRLKKKLYYLSYEKRNNLC